MKKLVFATNNQHKLTELQSILGGRYQLLSLADIGFFDDIPETRDTLEGNASQKANFVYDCFGMNCFADDTGLEVEALDNAPGVYSARYAGPQRSSDDNVKKLLHDLQKINNRAARFRTVISLIIDGKEKLFEGIVEGKIIDTPKGTQGFGYDPIFVPDGHNLTFAEMDMEEKNKISHRGRAVEKLVIFLNS
jgi:XTP/dITP diphosphohydrolase